MMGSMELYYHYFPVLSLISGLILLSLGTFSLFRRQLPGTGLFAILMFAGAEIAIFYFFETACMDIDRKYLFLKLQFFGTATISVIWLFISAFFSGFRKLLQLKYIMLLLVIPFITIIIVWTNDYHHLFWREIGLGEFGGVIYLDNSYGYWNWVHLFYTYITFIIGSVVLIRHAVKSKGLLRSQSLAFLIAAVIPWLLNVLFSINIFNRLPFDVSPLAFAVTGVALWWAIFRYHFLDIMPAAKDIVIENIRAGIVVTDIQNRVVEINGFIERVFSIPPSDIIGEHIHVLWNRLRLNKESGGEENEFLFDVEGTESYFELNIRSITTFRGEPAGTLIIILDVTDKKKADLLLKRTEELQYQSEKVEALGRLADGIAHEFNNILTIVYNYSKFTESKQSDMYEISSAIRRGQELTKQLLTFSRKHIVEKDLISVAEALKNVEKRCIEFAHETVTVEFIQKQDPGIILGNLHQLEQMVFNLVKNAKDAMPGGGTVQVAAGVVLLQENAFPENRNLTPGHYVYIQVRDGGEGIRKEIRERIFDPFFTTKEVGKGDGLGLSTVYGIVKQYKGHIEVDSKPGEGSIFTVYLPSYSSQD